MAGSGVHQRLGGAKHGLDLEQIAIPHHGLDRREAGIGAQHEEAAIANLVGQRAGIDLEDGPPGLLRTVLALASGLA